MVGEGTAVLAVLQWNEVTLMQLKTDWTERSLVTPLMSRQRPPQQQRQTVCGGTK